ncbi:MAG: hypothetical protein ACK5NT_04075 [Pyrinomonadaceae bacterium]
MDSNENTIDKEMFLGDILRIFRETFEGSPSGEGSIYLDHGVGVFSSLAEISSERASRDIRGTTLAAQVEHTKFYIDRLLEYIDGTEIEVNWELSWLITSVNPIEWDTLRAGIRVSYDNAMKKLLTIEKWNSENAGEAMAIVVHTAYHFGSIRQVLKHI